MNTPLYSLNRPTHSYWICSNPRSGSWLLAEGLTLTGLAGTVREWFQEEEQADQCSEWGIEGEPAATFPQYLSRLISEHTTLNGCFGGKLMYYQLQGLMKKLASVTLDSAISAPESLERLFPGVKYVWLRRRDLARQAISFYRATRTDLWWSIDGASKPIRPGSVPEAEYDPVGIARLEAELQRSDEGWEAFFRDAGITPLVLFYEDLADHYADTIAKVLEWLGVMTTDAVIEASPRLKKQSDATSEQWLEQYLAFKARGASVRFEIAIYQIAGDEMFKGRRAGDSGWHWSWADPLRDWMSQTPNKFAYRCLPLTIANQTGWWIYNPVDFTASWTGSPEAGSIQFEFKSEGDLWWKWINNQFGSGIITWNTPLLFRTRPAGSRLLISGPVNYFKHGVQPMSAIIESDWINMSFTMNWKLTQGNSTVEFKQGEPLFQVIPLSVNLCEDLQNAAVTYSKLSDDPQMLAAYIKWSELRDRFHQDKKDRHIAPDEWQKDYFKGQSGPSAQTASGHMTKVAPPQITYKSPKP